MIRTTLQRTESPGMHIIVYLAGCHGRATLTFHGFFFLNSAQPQPLTAIFKCLKMRQFVLDLEIWPSQQSRSKTQIAINSLKLKTIYAKDCYLNVVFGQYFQTQVLRLCIKGTNLQVLVQCLFQNNFADLFWRKKLHILLKFDKNRSSSFCVSLIGSTNNKNIHIHRYF